jgi:hypothetical protein
VFIRRARFESPSPRLQITHALGQDGDLRSRRATRSCTAAPVLVSESRKRQSGNRQTSLTCAYRAQVGTPAAIAGRAPCPWKICGCVGSERRVERSGPLRSHALHAHLMNHTGDES